MKLRSLGLIVTLALGILLTPLVGETQQTVKVWKIGFLGGSPSAVPQFIQAFQQGLRELGYVEDQNIAIERRYSEGKAERHPIGVGQGVLDASRALARKEHWR